MGTVVMVFAGEYDLACKEQLHFELAPLQEVENVVLDFTDVAYLDSTCITEFVRLHKARSAKGHEPETVIVRNKTVQKLFDMLSMHKIFRIVHAMDDAVGKDGEAAIVQYAFVGGYELEPELSHDGNGASAAPKQTAY